MIQRFDDRDVIFLVFDRDANVMQGLEGGVDARAFDGKGGLSPFGAHVILGFAHHAEKYFHASHHNVV